MSGLSVASSLVSLVKDSQVLPSNYSDTVNKLATSFVRSYHFSRSLLDAASYDAVILFNGRFASVKGRGLPQNKVICPFIFMKGVVLSHHTAFVVANHMTGFKYKELLQYWKKIKIILLKILEQISLSKRNGLDKAWVSFKENMKSGHAKACINNAKNITTGKVATFSSSEDEFISVSDAYKRSNFEWKGQDKALLLLRAPIVMVMP